VINILRQATQVLPSAKGGVTPRKLATATRPQFPRTILRCLEVEFLSLSESYVAVSSICTAPFSNTCSSQTDNNSRKLLLRCGCQFARCAPTLNVYFLNETLWNLKSNFFETLKIFGYLRHFEDVNDL
jgi:hypothetical protein